MNSFQEYEESLYRNIVEKMGGDPQNPLTEKECLQQLTELSDLEFLTGAYWAIKHIFPDRKKLLNELSLANNREKFLSVLMIHLLTNENIK